MKFNSRVILIALICLLVSVSAASACSLTIDKHLTNGLEGKNIPFGTPITWNYIVKNIANHGSVNVIVTDNKGVAVTCPKTTLAAGESMTCTASGTAVAGDYKNTGKVCISGSTSECVTDDSKYFGIPITIDKLTNGADGLELITGTPITWTYTVTNHGTKTLTNVLVTDNKGVAVTCPKTTLAAGESMTCTASGTAVTGSYSNIGTATGKIKVYGCEDKTVTATDGSSYTGIATNPHIGIVKILANGLEGTTIAAGTSISWDYTVTNTGNVPLTTVGVTDDQGVIVTCPKTTLAVGESMVCTGSGTAIAVPYSNIGTATGFGGVPVTSVTANDGSSYTGTASGGSSGSAVPEFPTMALPAAFIVGLVGIVLYVKSNREI